MTNIALPFRADTVGSYLRSPVLIDDVYWGTLCNNHELPSFAADKAQALENIQAILVEKPAHLTVTTHVSAVTINLHIV